MPANGSAKMHDVSHHLQASQCPISPIYGK